MTSVNITVNAPGFFSPEVSLLHPDEVSVDPWKAFGNERIVGASKIVLGLDESKSVFYPTSKNGGECVDIEISLSEKNGECVGDDVIILVMHDDGSLMFSTPSYVGAAGKMLYRQGVVFRVPVPLGRDVIEKRISSIFKKIFVWVIKKAAGYVIPKIEKATKSEESFLKLKGTDITDSKGSCVVFTHGIFSSIQKGLCDLKNDDLRELSNRYPGGVWGFDHWSVSKSPLENARDLQSFLQKLDCGSINLVCHSRGALVQRCLLEHPSLLQGNTGLRFDGAYFVAGACQGSKLADAKSIDSLVNVVLNLARLAGQVGEVIAFLGDLLLAGADALAAQPGVSALCPNSSLIQELNKPFCTPVGRGYVFSGANYDCNEVSMTAIKDIAVDKFFKCANDLVVPFDGAGEFDPFLSGAKIPTLKGPMYGTVSQSQSIVHHHNFFAQKEVVSQILSLT